MILRLIAQRLIREKIECRESKIKIILLEASKSYSTNEQQRISEKKIIRIDVHRNSTTTAIYKIVCDIIGMIFVIEKQI